MFNFDKHDVQRFAVSSIGALALSAACIIGVAGPARAATPNAPLTMADWQSTVERQLDGASRLALDSGTVRETRVAVQLTADGDFAGAEIARGSGNGAVDREALNVARHVAYPALPAGYRGQSQTVMVRLFSGMSADAVDAAREKARRASQVRYADAAGGRTTVAAK